MDSEGAELLVLQGASNLISSDHSPVIVLEECPMNLKNFDTSTEDVRHYLTDMGYELFQINTDGYLSPIKTQDDNIYYENIVAAKRQHQPNLPFI